MFKDIQPAIKTETKNVFISTLIGVVLMWAAFFVLNKIMPDTVPFDYTVFLGGIGGLIIAVLNFFFMGLTVQAVTNLEDEADARKLMKSSYSKRIGLQLLWIVLALALPVFFWVAGLLPLLFPSAGIKIKGIINQRKYNRQEVEQKQDGC